MPDYTIRPYKEGDEYYINESFNEVFGTNRSIEEWRWKFKPDENQCRILVVMDNTNRVLAHYAVTVVPWYVDGKNIFCGHTLDSFSIKRKDVLKNRLFLKLYDKFRDTYAITREFPFFYGCIGGRHKKLGTAVLKYTEPVPIEYFYKELPIAFRFHGRLIGDKIWSQYILRNTIPKISDVSELWENSKKRYTVSIFKDGNYIRDRYITHPVKNYYYIQIREKNKLSALAVLAYEDRLLKWVDLIWDGIDPDTITKLYSQIWSIAKTIGAIKVELWLNNDNEVRDILLQSGMNRDSNPYDLFVSSRSFDENLDGHDITKRLYFTMGNSDIV